MDNRTQLDRLIDDHFRYEATDDVEGVVGTFAADCEHEMVGVADGLRHGKAAIHRFYEALFASIQGEGVEPLKRYYGDNFLVDECIWHGQVTDGWAFGLPGRSGRASFRLLHVFELRDQHIASEHLWFDRTALERQLT